MVVPPGSMNACNQYLFARYSSLAFPKSPFCFLTTESVNKNIKNLHMEMGKNYHF
jgi:hypothetical protein